MRGAGTPRGRVRTVTVAITGLARPTAAIDAPPTRSYDPGRRHPPHAATTNADRSQRARGLAYVGGADLRMGRLFSRTSGRSFIAAIDHGVTIGVPPGAEDAVATGQSDVGRQEFGARRERRR